MGSRLSKGQLLAAIAVAMTMPKGNNIEIVNRATDKLDIVPLVGIDWRTPVFPKSKRGKFKPSMRKRK